ncbi:hypothetical protein FIE12Z_2210 [Fusarium flagelliforme]|uniref:Uncharacterized protein n=1 Tax=Fusarium flagelliforme TaxID=2675880 RepID=A0A395N0F1_9HYPO|nr:hypothetical protein FIE12Z_2210 [Fusarium flagelliforme]
MEAFVPAGDEATLAARYFVVNVSQRADKAQPKMKQFLETAISYFDLIQPSMNEQLADELAHFVEILSVMWKDDDLHLDDACDNALYREACSLMTQNIPYPLWFVLASAFGPGHSALAEMRVALSKAWGSEIPSDRISYPTCDSSSREFELFGLDPKLEAAASHAVTAIPIIPSTVPAASTSSDATKDSATHDRTTDAIADRLRFSQDKLKDDVKALEERTTKQSSALTNLQVQVDNHESINKRLVDECEQWKSENVALQTRVDALENLCHELVVRQDEMEQFLEKVFAPQPEGQSADNEEGEQETVDETFNSNLNKRNLPPDGSPEGAAKRMRCD